MSVSNAIRNSSRAVSGVPWRMIKARKLANAAQLAEGKLYGSPSCKVNLTCNFSAPRLLQGCRRIGSRVEICSYLSREATSVRILDASWGYVGRALRLPGTRAGGGPRTFPGGVNKWQWKRMQEKKARDVEKARLMREREAFEARRREQLRLLEGPERPWEGPSDRSFLAPAVALQVLPPLPENVANRFQRPGGEDLWNERTDGPVRYLRPDGQESVRSLPPDARFSTKKYQKLGPEVVQGARDRSRPASTASTSVGAQRVGLRSEPAVEHRNEQRGLPKWAEFDSTSRSAVRSETKTTDVGPGLSGVRVRGGEEEEQQHNPRRSAPRPTGGAAAGKAPAVPVETKTKQEPKVESAFMTDVRFDSFPIAASSVRALHEDMGYMNCTIVQAATLPVILTGKDVLAKAKTGTGKTIAFLLPAIEALLAAEAASASRGGRPAGPTPIRVLAICPARELAAQVAEEGKMLLQFHKGCGAQLVIGGTRMPAEVARLARQPCQILVATPGRLLDHIQSTPGFRQQLQGLQVFILDEADQLLDMGFRKTLEAIVAALPRGQQRQTLLFSATMPPQVENLAKWVLRNEYEYIDTVGKEQTETNIQVLQESMQVEPDKQLVGAYALLKQHMEEEADFKVLVFCTTARSTQLMAELFTALGVKTVLEIHSRKSQAYRTRVSDQFRQATGGVIMFTSDVSARGVDYPGVTLVLQMGVPADRAQYVHRLGRTGRAGRQGKGVLLLAPWEQYFLRTIKDLPVTPSPLPAWDAALEKKVSGALQKVSVDTKEKAYQAWLGYYNSARGLGWDKATLVHHANLYSSILGLKQPPALMKRTIGMMGLKGVPGLRIAM